MFFKKMTVSLLIASSLFVTSCGIQGEKSEVKGVSPATQGAVKLAIGIAAALRSDKTAVKIEHIRQILDALQQAKSEIMRHDDQQLVQKWVSNVDGLSLAFERYTVINQSPDQLNSFLLELEESSSQLETIFRDLPSRISYVAAPAFNALAAMRLIALMDYSRDANQVRNLLSRTINVNNKLLALPIAPGKVNAQNFLIMDNCKVFMAPYISDNRDHIFFSAFKLWDFGYYKGHEFRIYNNGQLISKCFEDKNGANASNSPFFISMPWNDLASKMYNESRSETVNNPMYRAIQESNEAFEAYRKTL